MALIKCSECGKEISDKATSCPNCGCPINGEVDEPNVPHCPACNSTDIEKISTASKVGKTLLFGIFASGSNAKTFHCKNCGYKW